MENHSSNKVGGLLAVSVSAGEAICAMRQLNELARKVGPYSEEELKARNIATSRFKRLAHSLFPSAAKTK